jgi:hypothetical protein
LALIGFRPPLGVYWIFLKAGVRGVIPEIHAEEGPISHAGGARRANPMIAILGGS